MSNNQDPNNIDLTLFLDLCHAIINKKPYLGVGYTDIPRLVRLAQYERNITKSLLKELVDELAPPEVEDIQIDQSLIHKRQEELREILRWLIPSMSIGGKVPIPYTILVESSEGQGKTKMLTALYSAIRKLSPDAVHVLDGDDEGSGTYKRGSVLLVDGGKNLNSSSRLPHSLIYVVFTNSADAEKARKNLNSPVFRFKLEPMDSSDVLECIRKGSILPNAEKLIDPDDLQYLLDNDLSPKDLIACIRITNSLSEYKEKKSGQFDRNILYLASEKLGIFKGSNVPLEELRSFMKSRVYGQDSIVEDLVVSIAKFRYGLRDPKKPLLTAMFIGTTGTGKTSTAKVVSEAIFGHDDIIKLDMGEYNQSHTSSNMFGAPPGYVGYNTDPYLVTELKKNKSRVVLLDEIEKAHPTILSSILHILDEGKFTTGKSESLDMTGCVIILTSNSLTDKLGKPKIGLRGSEEESGYTVKEVREMLAKQFPPEFVNRIDIMAVFDKLTDDAAMAIAKRELEKTKRSMLAKGIEFTYDKSLLKQIAKKYNKEFGGRDVIRLVEKIRTNLVSDILKEKENVKKIKARLA